MRAARRAVEKCIPLLDCIQALNIPHLWVALEDVLWYDFLV